MDELIDIVDENNVIIRQVMKSEAHAKGLWHRSAHVWMYNSKGQVLLQLRAKRKILLGGVWDVSVGGHIAAGEEVLDGVKREVLEEIGVSTENLKFINLRKDEILDGAIDNKEFLYIYLMKCELGEEEFTIQKEELDDLKWFDIDFILKDMYENADKYIPKQDYWKEILNKIKKLS